jgi:hypothetical protein
VPFSEELPKLPGSVGLPTVFYGATTFIDLIYRNTLDGTWAPATYFNPHNVCSAWLQAYKHHALNFDSMVTTIQELVDGKYDLDWMDDGNIFIRPYDDKKIFAGDVVKVSELKEWAKSLMTNAPNVLHYPVIAGPAYRLTREWRLFMHEREFVSGSLYRVEHRYKESPNVPWEVRDFAIERAKEYNPIGYGPWVLDIGENLGDLFVIEVGCFNSAGFYSSNVKEIVKTISERNQ